MSTRKPIQRLPHIVRALAPIKIGKIRIRTFTQDSSTPKREPEKQSDTDDNWIQIGKALPEWLFKEPEKKGDK